MQGIIVNPLYGRNVEAFMTFSTINSIDSVLNFSMSKGGFRDGVSVDPCRVSGRHMRSVIALWFHSNIESRLGIGGAVGCGLGEAVFL